MFLCALVCASAELQLLVCQFFFLTLKGLKYWFDSEYITSLLTYKLDPDLTVNLNFGVRCVNFRR